MSALYITHAKFGKFKMNVIAFTAPLVGQITSVQTKTMAHHFPIKADQPNIQFSVVFRSEKEYENFQKFVRNMQKDCLNATTTSAFGITLWWPERGIDNWTGMIREFSAGGSRGNWAPKAKFTVDLVDSMTSQRTVMASFGTDYSSVFSNTSVDSLLQQPSIGSLAGNAIGALPTLASLVSTLPSWSPANRGVLGGAAILPGFGG